MIYCRSFVFHKINYILLLSALLFSINTKIIAQENFQQDYIVNQYTTSNGLSQNTAKKISFDSNGNLWVGTEFGLSCFDGNVITNFILNKKYPRISKFFRTESMDLMVADSKFNIYSINHNTKKVKQISTPDVQSTINWLHELTGAPYSELKRFSEKDLDLFFRYEFYYFSKSKSFISVVNEHDIYYLGKTFKFLKRIEKAKRKMSLSNNLIIVNNDFSVDVINGNSEFYRNVKIVGDLPSNLTLGEFLVQGIDFCTSNKDFLLFNSTIYQVIIENNIIHLKKQITNIPAIKDFTCIAYDENSRNLAFGTNTEGFFLLYKNHIKNQIVKTDNNKSETNTINIIYSLIQIDSNKILSTNGYIYKTNSSNPVLYKQSNHLFNKDVDISRRLLYKDLENNIWSMGNNLKFINKYDSSFQVIGKYKNPEKSTITGMFESANKKFYLHSPNAIFVLEKDSIRQLFQVPNEIFTPKYEINRLKSFNDNTILIATSLGLFSSDLNFKRILLCKNSPKVNIREIYQLKDSSFILGTYGDGIYVFKNNQFISLPLDKEKGLITAHTFLRDSKGYLWITSNNGLFQVMESDIIDFSNHKSQFIYYYKICTTNGLLTNEFNGGCSSPSAFTKDGTIFFPSMKGVVMFNPNEIKPMLPTSRVNIHCNFNDTNYSSTFNDEVLLPSGVKNIDLYYSIVYFGVSSNLITEYRLLGVDTSWNPINAEQKIRYTNLSSGIYTFEIRKKGPGISNVEYENLKIIVQKKFYEKWWFYLCCFVVLLLIYWIILRLHSGKRRRDNIKLIKLVQEQTKQLTAQNKSLESSNKLNEVLISVLMHDINGPLNFQIKNSEMITQHFDRIDDTTKKKFINDLHQSSKQMHQYVYRILNWLKFRNQSKLEIEKISLFSLCKDLLPVEIAKLDNKKNVEIIFDVPENCFVLSNQRVLSIVFTNIVDNAIKYTQSGYVKISASILPNNTVQLICKDTGKGMSEEAIQKLLSDDSLNYENVNSNSFEIGYVIIKELLRLINGKFKIESEVDKGTSIVLTLDGANNDQ